ncbi:MAG: DUF4198 domain-containing protein [Deltaproteobacteria bacterium]|nr:DUF4198 domain-containing protein [Deltaproteobacteria bacterium]
MKKEIIVVAIIVMAFMFQGHAFAHYGMVIPSDSMVMQKDSKMISLRVSFSHPFERVGMDLTKPKAFGVMANGKKLDLLASLKKDRIMGYRAWKVDYKINRPGVYMFYMEPEPYWESAEDCFIIHYTKTVVTAFGDDEGWDEGIGLKTEIIPLSKPFGLYAGNVFQGMVKLNGKPVPFAKVEIEYYNEDGSSEAPTAYMMTQTIKADPNGVFTYAVPKAGWWGFAALNTSNDTIQHDGEEKDVELGAVIWVKFHDWKMK